MSYHIIYHIILYHIILHHIVWYCIIIEHTKHPKNYVHGSYYTLFCCNLVGIVRFYAFFSKTWWRHRMELQYGKCNKTSTDFFTEWEHKFAFIPHFDIHVTQFVRNPSHASQEHEYRFTEQSDVLTPDTWMTQTREFGARMIGDLTKRMG